MLNSYKDRNKDFASGMLFWDLCTCDMKWLSNDGKSLKF